MENSEHSKVSPDEVKKIASLSRLNLEGKELISLTEDFNQILEFVQQISEVDTENVEPLNHVLDLENVTRKDEAGESFKREEVESIAPEFNAGYFVVPRVLDTES